LFFTDKRHGFENKRVRFNIFILLDFNFSKVLNFGKAN